jgi:alpha-beta hydrolase superfamily lysophospholipase
MVYALDALEDPGLRRPDRIVLLSPMIGITAFARFSGIAGWPAILPIFERAAWFDLFPEFNPFKYNSFPVNGGKQSWQLTQAVQSRLDRAARSGALAAIAPILTFQSVTDSTISAPALVSQLYARLPANGSELVLYDVNRAAELAPLLRPAARNAAAALLPPGPRSYRTIVIGDSPDSSAAIQTIQAPGGTDSVTEPLGIDYPRAIFSLSHVAPPFPPWDGLYGYAPANESDGSESFGIRLGALAGRGELGTLRVGLDWFGRLQANPFFEPMLARIGAFAGLGAGGNP